MADYISQVGEQRTGDRMVVLDVAQWWSFGGSVRLAWYSENRVCKWWWNWNEKKQGPSGLPDIESHCSLKVCKVFVVVPHDDWVFRQKLSMPHRHNSVQALEPLASSHIHTKARAKGPYRIFHNRLKVKCTHVLFFSLSLHWWTELPPYQSLIGPLPQWNVWRDLVEREQKLMRNTCWDSERPQ